ncbi:hypothetical protein, partial [Escherichia coli]|uniref:hypothetical protein n=1 Tax=Escherichia coli TaxID=562 RepID=UPI0030C6FC57
MTLSFFITVIPDHDKPQPPGCLLDEADKEFIGKSRGDHNRLGTVAKLAMRQPFVLFKGLT